MVILATDLGTPKTAIGGMVGEPLRIATVAGLPTERVAGATEAVFPVFGAGAAGIAAEGAAKTEYDAISPGSAVPQVVNAWTDYTRQAATSHLSFEQLLRQKLAALVASREDQLLQPPSPPPPASRPRPRWRARRPAPSSPQPRRCKRPWASTRTCAWSIQPTSPRSWPPGEQHPARRLAELSLTIFGMRIYPTSHQTAGFALIGAWRACSTLVVGMDPTYLVDPYTGLKTNKITTLLEEAVAIAVREPQGFISVDLVV